MKKNLVIQLFDKNYEFLKKLKKGMCVTTTVIHTERAIWQYNVVCAYTLNWKSYGIYSIYGTRNSSCFVL